MYHHSISLISVVVGSTYQDVPFSYIPSNTIKDYKMCKTCNNLFISRAHSRTRTFTVHLFNPKRWLHSSTLPTKVCKPSESTTVLQVLSSSKAASSAGDKVFTVALRVLQASLLTRHSRNLQGSCARATHAWRFPSRRSDTREVMLQNNDTWINLA